MHTSVRLVVLSLLVAALVSLGIARAGTVFCPADCSLGVAPVESTQVVHPCCNEPAGAAEDGAGGRNDGSRPAACGHCSLSSGKSETAADITLGSAPAGIDAAIGVAGPADIGIAEASPTALRQRPLSPCLRKAPDLFTRNCSFLI